MHQIRRATGIAALVTVLAGCSTTGYNPQHTTTYHATCTDQYGRILADWRCDQHRSGSRWEYEPYATYQQHLRSNRSYYTVGRACTCGTTTQPKSVGGKPVGVQYANRKTVTVFKNGKQAGSPVKLNQDAKKASTVGRSTTKSSFGSTSGKTTNKTSSTPRRK